MLLQFHSSSKSSGFVGFCHRDRLTGDDKTYFGIPELRNAILAVELYETEKLSKEEKCKSCNASVRRNTSVLRTAFT